MYAEIGGSDGAMHQFKNGTEIGYSDGANHKINLIEIGGSDGANHVVWRAADCQAHNYVGGIAADGSLSFVLPQKSMTLWFRLHFETPVTISSASDLVINSISHTNDLEIAVYSGLYDSGGQGGKGIFNGNVSTATTTATFTLASGGAGSYSDFYFYIEPESDSLSVSAPAGCITLAGKQINDVELI